MLAVVCLLGAALLVGPVPCGTPIADRVTYHALVTFADDDVRLIIVSAGHMKLPGQDNGSGIRFGDDLSERILKNRWHVRGRSQCR